MSTLRRVRSSPALSRWRPSIGRSSYSPKRHTAENAVYLVVGLVREPDEAVPQLRDRGIEVRSLTTLGAVIRGAWPKLDSDQRQRLLDEFPTLPQDAEIRELVQT